MALSLGTVTILPLSIQADPGMVRVRLWAVQQAWEPAEIEAKRFTLRSGHLDFHPLPLKLRLEPYVPTDFRLDFPVQTLSEPLLLRCSRGLFVRYETLDLLRQPLSDPDERRVLEEACFAAWFERALELDLAYHPRKLRSGEMSLEEATQLLDRYLHGRPQDAEAAKCLERLKYKKELARAFHAGDWLRVARLNTAIRALQPDWEGPGLEERDPLEMADDALRNGWLEAAEQSLLTAVERGRRKHDAALMLARLASAWRRDIPTAARWYVNYFAYAGPNEEIAREAREVIDALGAQAAGPRGQLLDILAERLVARPNDPDLAEIVFSLAEAQAAAGLSVDEDFALLWACYERAFEHQVAVDKRVERTLLERLAGLHARLGNDDEWFRVRRALADLEPWNAEYREQLARLLAAKGRVYEALYARMALVLAAPTDARRIETLAAAAAAAGETALAARARAWHALLIGLEPEAAPTEFQGAVDELMHPELRPLTDMLVPKRSELDPGVLRTAVLALFDPIPTLRLREFEVAAKERVLSPSLEAALMVRDGRVADDLHPLRVAARLSLDRMELVERGDMGAALSRLGLRGEAGALLDATAGLDAPIRRLIVHRIRELAKFYLVGSWDAPRPSIKPADRPLSELIEALYLRGLPDTSTRAYIEDVARIRKVSRRQVERIEKRVLGLLWLGAPAEVEMVDL